MLVLLAACTVATERPVATTTPTGPPPAADRAPDPAPRPPSTPDPTAPQACDPATRAAIGAPVTAQLEALTVGDFDGAYAVTSPFFRTVVSRAQFELLIRDAYPELVGNGGHRLDECGVRGRRGFIVVGVRSGVRTVVLRYDLSQEEDGWRIDGAIALPGVTLPPDPVI